MPLIAGEHRRLSLAGVFLELDSNGMTSFDSGSRSGCGAYRNDTDTGWISIIVHPRALANLIQGSFLWKDNILQEQSINRLLPMESK